MRRLHHLLGNVSACPHQWRCERSTKTGIAINCRRCRSAAPAHPRPLSGGGFSCYQRLLVGIQIPPTLLAVSPPFPLPFPAAQPPHPLPAPHTPTSFPPKKAVCAAYPAALHEMRGLRSRGYMGRGRGAPVGGQGCPGRSGGHTWPQAASVPILHFRGCAPSPPQPYTAFLGCPTPCSLRCASLHRGAAAPSTPAHGRVWLRRPGIGGLLPPSPPL